MTRELSLPGYSFARVYDEVTSTMDVARESISQLGDGAGVVCALSQSAGRGRQGRSWSSTRGAMMATFLFQTTLPVAALSGYSLVVGLALADAFEELGAALRLKWPNDLVVVRNDTLMKIGGILIEVQDLKDKRVVLVGVGVNLSQAPDSVANALSIEDICGQVMSVDDALALTSKHLRTAHELFSGLGGFAKFKRRWEDASCFAPGETEITLDLGDRHVSGRFAGIDESGSLLLAVSGEVKSFHSGHLLACRNLRS